jgi:hypothetical protein
MGVALAALVLVGAVAPRRALALTPAEWTIRNQLITDAKAAHTAGDHTKALSLALKALALEATPSLHYFVAREEEETGALADGFATAQQCGSEAEHDTTLHNRDEILKGCNEIENRLKGRVAYVVVEAKDRPEGLRVKLSGQDLNGAALGIPYVVTPGTVVVEATAPGRSPYRLEVAVPKGKTINVAVTLEPAQALAQPPVAAPPTVAPISGPAAPPQPLQLGQQTDSVPNSPTHKWKARTVGFVVVAAGVASLATAGIFAGRALVKKSDYESDPTCTYDCPALDEANTSGRYATGFGIAGLALGGVGAALIFLRSDTSEPKRSPEMTVGVGLQRVMLVGRF